MCDACEKQPCAITLKEDVSALLSELDSLAREQDNYDYGLPLGMDAADEEMREAVYRFLAKYRPDIKTEEAVATADREHHRAPE